MSERVLEQVMAMADQLRDQAAEAERIGRLTDDSVKLMKAAGLIRLLQPKNYRGFEVHPREFAETVMATAALDPAAGWIVGVVGVHPYQLAYADPKVAAEVWGDDVDTWMASPYAPQGVAKPVNGGYIFNGRWQFSSGTDHCDWIFLGAFLGDAEGKPVMPPQMLHMILPRKDYEIVEDSWNVVGLRGTGSKDVIVKDAFVPAYRTMDATKVMDGTAQREAGMTEPLYLMPWSTMFPLGISAATIGIAEGALAAHLDYQRQRVGATGTAIKDDPYVMYAVGEAAADINAARQNCWPTPTASTTWSPPAKRSRSRTARRAGAPRSAPCGARSRRSTTSSRARVATPRAWTSRCSGTGATCMSARCTPSMSPGPSTTLRRSVRWASIRPWVRCAA